MIPELLGTTLEEGDPLGDTGLTYHPSMDIHDASKLQAFMDSPRKYFFQYVLGWRAEDPNVHLVFGSGWHHAMEHLLLSLNGEDPYSNRVVVEAWQMFMDTYRADFPNEFMDDQHGAKDPTNALKALAAYAAAWASDVKRYKTLYTEVAGSVMVRHDRLVHWKMDSILTEDDQHIVSMEHKTTGRKTQAWLDSWNIILQPLIYQHALRTVFQDYPVKGVLINGAILRKSGNEFVRIPVSKSDKMMLEGLWRTNHILDQVEWNWRNLLDTTPNDDVLPAFPCNGVSCSKFGCGFSSFCGLWSNPLQHAETPPLGFGQEFWDPRREDAKYHVSPEGTITQANQKTDAPAEAAGATAAKGA